MYMYYSYIHTYMYKIYPCRLSHDNPAVHVCMCIFVHTHTHTCKTYVQAQSRQQRQLGLSEKI